MNTTSSEKENIITLGLCRVGLDQAAVTGGSSRWFGVGGIAVQQRQSSTRNWSAGGGHHFSHNEVCSNASIILSNRQRPRQGVRYTTILAELFCQKVVLVYGLCWTCFANFFVCEKVELYDAGFATSKRSTSMAQGFCSASAIQMWFNRLGWYSGDKIA